MPIPAGRLPRHSVCDLFSEKQPFLSTPDGGRGKNNQRSRFGFLGPKFPPGFSLLGLLLLLALPAAASAQMATGSYTGDGSSSRAIAGIGFQPSVVIIKGNASIEAILRTSSMSGDNSKKLGSNDVFFAGGVISLDADGFTLGSNNRVNAAGTTYYWIAFKEDAMSLKVSTYTGDGVDNHVITGVGFTPAAVLVFREGTSNVAIKTSSMASNESKLFYSTSTYTDRVKTLMADGFTLGTSAEVNAIGDTYHYVAWKAVAGSMQTGSYEGDDTDDRNINAPGFKPS
jgi:hypothetical protein